MPEPMPVKIRGRVYSSAREAAKKLGVKPITVWTALKRGRPDSVGLGPGHRPPASRKGGREKIPVAIGPLRYESIAAAARDLGYDKRNLWSILNGRRPSEMPGLLARAMRRVDRDGSR